MTTRWARVARGWAIAGFSTFVAALSHSIGSGHTPGWLGVVLSLAFAGLICTGLAGAAVSRTRVAVSVVASQLIFHGLFALGAPGGRLAQSSPAGAHGHDVAKVVADSTGGSAASDPHGGWVWAAHAVAAVITIAALRHGDAAIRRVADLARLALSHLIPAGYEEARVPAIQAVPAAAAEFTRRGLVRLSSCLIRRGPPGIVTPVA